MAENPPVHLFGRGLLPTERIALSPSPEDMRQRVADVIRLTSDVVFETDRRMTLTYVSARVLDVLGYQPWELVGRSLFAIGRFVGEDGKPSAPDWHRPFRDRTFQALGKDGALRHLLISALPVFDPSSETHIGIRGTAEDRTRRKADEDRLRKLSQAIEQSPGSIIITDRNGVIEYVNRRFTEVSGYSFEEVVGRTPALVNSGHMPRSLYREMWDALTSGQEWRGELYNRKKNGEGIWEYTVISPIIDEHGQITHFVGTKEDVTERKRIENELLKKGNSDDITGLPNRMLAFDRLEQLLARVQRHDSSGALMMIGLDHFKRINDVLGHIAGDKILREAGARLASQIRPEDTVARMGGDEFCVVASDCGMAEVEALAQRLIRSFTQPFTSTGQEIFVTPSVGITVFPADGNSAADLMRNAHTAAHRVKEMGGNAFQFFTPDMNVRAEERARLEASLHHALERNELQMQYQVMVDVASGQITGAEALMRWNSPEFGRVPPDQFIPLAESSALIIKLGEWALHTACRQAADWVKRYGSEFRMAVNVSVEQVRIPGFADLVFRTLDETGLKSTNLELEITESLLMEGTGGISEMARLRDAGIKLSIDDFGTGYSSLSYLKRFPVCTLKIDRSFVRDLADGGTDVTLVKAIIAMAHSLGLGVVAEGVETLRQLEVLRSLDCNIAQGFLFGAAVPPVNFADTLPRQSRPSDETAQP